MLQSDTEKYEADTARLAREIAKHHQDISTWEADFKDATKVHEIENADCIATHKASTEPIDALGEGSQTLEAQTHDVKQAAAALTKNSAPCSKEETNARHAVEMLSQVLKSQINQATSAHREC